RRFVFQLDDPGPECRGPGRALGRMEADGITRRSRSRLLLTRVQARPRTTRWRCTCHGEARSRRLQLPLRVPEHHGYHAEERLLTHSDPTYVGDVQAVTGALVRVRIREDLLSALLLVEGQSHRVGQVGAFLRIPLGYVQLY